MNIADLIKDFLNKNIEEQREIITLFILSDNTDIEYIAYLLYDIISSESSIQNKTLSSDNLFNSLHWTIQKKFKYIFTNILKTKKQLFDFNVNSLCGVKFT